MVDYDKLFPVAKYDPEMERHPIPWLVEGLLQKGKINGISGFEKSGKSRILGWLLVGLNREQVLGQRVYGLPPRVLYLCGEETKEDVNGRIKGYGQLQGISDIAFDVTFMDAAGMRLEMKQQRDWLLQKILDENYELVVMDPMRRLHSANEDKSTDMAPIYNDIRRWSNNHGITIVMVHHTGKVGDDTDMARIANWFRGSTDMAAILDAAVYVNRVTKNTVQLRRQGRFQPLPDFLVNDLGDKAGFKRSQSGD